MDPITLILGWFALDAMQKESAQKAWCRGLYHLLHGLEAVEASHRRESLRVAILSLLPEVDLPADGYIDYERKWAQSRNGSWLYSAKERQDRAFQKAIKAVQGEGAANFFEVLVKLGTIEGVSAMPVARYLLNVGTGLGHAKTTIWAHIIDSLFAKIGNAAIYLSTRGVVACSTNDMDKPLKLLHEVHDRLLQVSEADRANLLEFWFSVPDQEKKANEHLNSFCDEHAAELPDYLALQTLVAPLNSASSLGVFETWVREGILSFARGHWRNAVAECVKTIHDDVEEDEEDGQVEQADESQPLHLGALRVLGLDEDATFEDVRAAYRKLAKQFHPDAVSGKGLNEEFVRFAEQKFKEIKAAYDLLNGIMH